MRSKVSYRDGNLNLIIRPLTYMREQFFDISRMEKGIGTKTKTILAREGKDTYILALTHFLIASYMFLKYNL